MLWYWGWKCYINNPENNYPGTGHIPENSPILKKRDITIGTNLNQLKPKSI